MHRSKLVLWLVAGLTLLAGHLTAGAADFPTKPLRIVVPYAVGGASDIFARTIAQKLSERLSQPVVVENRVGAGGIIGADHVSKAAPDGHTLLLGSVGIYDLSPALYPKLPYKASDLTPVVEIASSPLLMVTAAGSSLKSIQDVIAREKQRPGGLNMASAGAGSITHLAIMLLNESAGTRLQHVPYRGGGVALVDVMSGQVDMMFIGTPPAMPAIADGRIRVLAVTSARRVASLSDVPTLAESVASGFEATSEDAIFLPSGTPAEIVALLHREITQVINLPDVRKRWTELAANPGRSLTPDQLRAALDRSAAKWGKLVTEANIKLD
jgi:tripartite-type tricarboxylate transporter receptor subunit TctC